MSIKTTAATVVKGVTNAIAFVFSVRPDPGYYYGLTCCINYRAVNIYLGENSERIIYELLSK